MTSGNPSANTGTSTGSAFVIGTDAPVASVVSFNATIQSINAIDANNNSVPLVSGSPTVDFARYNGLQTLLDMNDVPADTYTQIHNGPAVPHGHVEAGDLIFPEAGHVMLAISPTRVIEAQQSGVPVKISPMPSSYQAHRPTA